MKLTKETKIDGFDVSYILGSIGYLTDCEYEEIDKRFKTTDEVEDYLFSKMNIDDYKNFVRKLMKVIDDGIDNGYQNLEDLEGEFCKNYGLDMLKKYSKINIKEEYYL